MIPEQIKKSLGKESFIYRVKNDNIVHFFDQNVSRTTPCRTFILKEGDEVWSRMQIDEEAIKHRANPKLECHMVNGSEIVSVLISMKNLEV